MPSPEVPLQHDMFTGAVVDTRSQRQRQFDRNLAQPHQAELFSAREVAQFGVKAKPLIPLSPWTRLALVPEDSRTSEEKERDAQREAERQTHQLFDQSGVPSRSPEKPGVATATVETVTNLEGITRHYIYLEDDVIAMTLGAMYWNKEEVEAQLRTAQMIASAINAQPVDAAATEKSVSADSDITTG